MGVLETSWDQVRVPVSRRSVDPSRGRGGGRKWRPSLCSSGKVGTTHSGEEETGVRVKCRRTPPTKEKEKSWLTNGVRMWDRDEDLSWAGNFVSSSRPFSRRDTTCFSPLVGVPYPTLTLTVPVPVPRTPPQTRLQSTTNVLTQVKHR